MTGAAARDSADVVRTWFKRLNDTFGAVVRDEQVAMGQLLDFYAVPVTITSDDEHQVLIDSASIRGFLNGAVDSLRHADYDRTVINCLDVWLLNARAAIIDVDVSRLNTSGDEVAGFRAIEIASRTDAGWRISAVFATQRRS
jgi:hypothetical protein